MRERSAVLFTGAAGRISYSNFRPAANVDPSQTLSYAFETLTPQARLKFTAPLPVRLAVFVAHPASGRLPVVVDEVGHRVHGECDEVHGHEHGRQMLFAVAEVVLEVVMVLSVLKVSLSIFQRARPLAANSTTLSFVTAKSVTKLLRYVTLPTGSGEPFHELDLLIGEGPDFSSVDNEGTDQLLLLEHGHRYK
jgi:hypothetical protein